jgi:hypothetical protein
LVNADHGIGSGCSDIEEGSTKLLWHSLRDCPYFAGQGVGESRKIHAKHRDFGYENLLVCDGSAFAASPGARVCRELSD